MPTIIEFDREHGEAVTEPIDDVQAALMTAMANQNPPMARLTRVQGDTPILINASLVRALWERDTGPPRQVVAKAV